MAKLKTSSLYSAIGSLDGAIQIIRGDVNINSREDVECILETLTSALNNLNKFESQLKN